MNDTLSVPVLEWSAWVEVGFELFFGGGGGGAVSGSDSGMVAPTGQVPSRIQPAFKILIYQKWPLAGRFEHNMIKLTTTSRGSGLLNLLPVTKPRQRV